MKKVLALAALVGVSFGAFGQGFIFQSTKGQGVYFTPESGAYGIGNNTITVGFMFGAPSITSAIGAGLATNYNGSALSSSVWTTILGDSNFQLATNSGSVVSVAVNNSGLTQGGYNYNGGNAFVPANTTAGNTYSVFAIAWSSAYATPLLAAQNNSFLGWSSVFQYASSPNSSSAPPTFAFAGIQPFGIATLAVPEPGTLALAALGGASLLLFRRRK